MANFVIDAAVVVLQYASEIASFIIKSIYDFAMAIATDPIVIYVTRTLVVEPIIAAANFVGTAYLGFYAFITNNATKYSLFIIYLMPVIEYFL